MPASAFRFRGYLACVSRRKASSHQKTQQSVASRTGDACPLNNALCWLRPLQPARSHSSSNRAIVWRFTSRTRSAFFSPAQGRAAGAGCCCTPLERQRRGGVSAGSVTSFFDPQNFSSFLFLFVSSPCFPRIFFLSLFYLYTVFSFLTYFSFTSPTKHTLVYYSLTDWPSCIQPL